YSNEKFRETNKKILQEEKNKIEKELSFSFPDLDAIY
ncbi:IclR family transcriptional regulator, partial [Campylobacter upsaliensis]|nr:IclR family transcriptional regulator [Campylobacter upsaliensis]